MIRNNAVNDYSTKLRDGLAEIQHELPLIAKLVADTCRWVNPETFRAMPVWYPEYARGDPAYKKCWKERHKNTNQTSLETRQSSEANIMAARALHQALGISRPKKWTVCHIWGVDDTSKPNEIVRSPLYYSCIGNMVLLPTPLKGFTDSVPSIKQMLRACAYHLYGWACDAPQAEEEAERIRAGILPQDYPAAWPTAKNRVHPPNTAPFSKKIRDSIARRHAAIRRQMSDPTLAFYPKERTRITLESWGMQFSIDEDRPSPAP